MTWEDIMKMQQDTQAAAQKNKAMSAQGAQTSAQEAQKSAASADAQSQMMGKLVGTAAGAAIGGPMSASFGGQLGGAAAGGEIDPVALGMGVATSGMMGGLDSAAGGAAGEIGMANAGISGEQADMLSGQMEGFGLSDRMATGQFFANGGPVKHYKGGGTVGQSMATPQVSIQPATQLPEQYNQGTQLTGALNQGNESLVGGVMDATQQPCNTTAPQQLKLLPGGK